MDTENKNKNLGGYQGTGQYGVFDGVQYNTPTVGSPYGSTGAIPVAKLDVSPTITLPEKPVEAMPSVDLTSLDITETEAEKKATIGENDVNKVLEAMGIIESQQDKYQEDLGAIESKKSYRDYEQKLQDEKESFKQRAKQLQETFGGTTAGLQNMMDKLERESYAKQADLSINANMAMGRYNDAIQTAKDKVAFELKPLERQLEAKKYTRDNNQDWLTTVQKAKLTASINADERKLEEEKENRIKGEQMIIDAQALKAPSSVVEKAKEILKNGGTKLDVAQALGKYNRDLDMELKTAQIAKTWADAKKVDVDSGTLSESQVKQIDISPQGKKLGALSGLYQKSQTYKNLVDLNGFKAVGANKALLDSAYADLKIAYKEAANLGALTGPDVSLIEEAIKPSSGAKNYLEYKLSGGQLGVSGAIDKALFKARKEALQNYKQLTARNTEYKGSEYVSSLITPFAKDYSTINLDTIEAGEIIQTEDGLLLESLGGGNFSPL